MTKQTIDEVRVIGYTLFRRSTLIEETHEYIYSFGVQVDSLGDHAKFAPEILVERDYATGEYEVKIQSSGIGSLSFEEHDQFMKAHQQAYFAGKQIKQQVEIFIEAHNIMLEETW